MSSTTTNPTSSVPRQLGLFGATSVGVGAIVGGGILALAGVAFAATGPAAIVAFALNGLIALLTALSISEMAARFPESGGTYTFSKKVLSVDAAFSVGWVVWFASIVAAVLYALGFAHFVIVMIVSLLGDQTPVWITSPAFPPVLAVVTTLLIGLMLMKKSAGGGNLANIAKVVVFAVLVLVGLIAVFRQSTFDTGAALKPFFSNGFSGLIQAMGYTFIALQGFDLIAAVGGEVRNPEKTLPRAIIISLLIALAIYLPLLFVIAVVGSSDGTPIAVAASANQEGIVAEAARNYMGAFGYWLVIIAAVLSMFSALEANLFAASRIAFTMARDRTLPTPLSRLNAARIPLVAVATTALMVSILIVLIPDVATAGAASSLIFLITFAVAHGLSILIRRRSPGSSSLFRTPLFPLVPVIGGLACLGLAVFQGIAVPLAGLIAGGWLLAGAAMFLGLFSGRARIRDATVAAFNPELARLRGRSPLVLVPIANPGSAQPLIMLARALVPPGSGRVLLQHVVVAPDGWETTTEPGPIERSQEVMNRLLTTTASMKIRPEVLTTIAANPMPEIVRVARLHQCHSIVMGLSKIADDQSTDPTERLLSAIDIDIAILRAREGWQLGDAHRILVPVAGRGGHEFLLARVLGSLSRGRARQVTWVRIVPPGTSHQDVQKEKRGLEALAGDLMAFNADVKVIVDDDPAQALADAAENYDLILLGATRIGRREKVLGDFTRRVAKLTDCPLIVMSNRNQ